LSHSTAAYSTAGVCANCAAPLPDDARLDVVADGGPAVNRSLAAGTAAPAEARHVVSELPLEALARERLALVVSELVTNSLRHAGLAAGEPIDLHISRNNGHVRVAVHDGGPGFDPSARAASPEANGNGGFGLAIVAGIAREWGVDSGPHGSTVWCTVNVS
jgi:anti-sigma regulatory factor (Ser/Thr protein kinase)